MPVNGSNFFFNEEFDKIDICLVMNLFQISSLLAFIIEEDKQLMNISLIYFQLATRYNRPLVKQTIGENIAIV